MKQLKSKPSPRLDQPLLGDFVVEAIEVILHLLERDRQVELVADFSDGIEGSRRILKCLPEQSLAEVSIILNACVQSSCVGHDRDASDKTLFTPSRTAILSLCSSLCSLVELRCFEPRG